MPGIYPVPLTPDAIQALFQDITIKAVGLPDNSYDKVRVGWQRRGQPAWGVDDDLIFLRAVEEDDLYNRVREVETVAYDDRSLALLTTYTRVWRVFWTIVGPSSFDRARVVRSTLFNQDIHDLFATWQLYLITDPAAPMRVPEFFEGLWRERVDFSAQFNEAVSETKVVGTVRSVTVEIVTVDDTIPVL